MAVFPDKSTPGEGMGNPFLEDKRAAAHPGAT
jgi:hypothetical protein